MERTRRLAQRLRQDEQQELQLRAASAAAAPPETDDVASVHVISGASAQTLPLAGLQVSEARNLVGTMFNIDPDAPVLVNGELIAADYRLADGDTLEFVHHAGEKGGRLGPSH